MQKNETLKTIASLRTTHWGFSEKKVSREDIETIIEHSLRTANSDNLTDYSVIVVDDPETLQKITGGESSGSSGVCLVYAVDHTRIVRCAEALGYRDFYPTNRLYNFLISLYDVHAAAQTAVIAAKSMEIDSLVTNFSHRHHPEKIKILFPCDSGSIGIFGKARGRNHRQVVEKARDPLWHIQACGRDRHAGDYPGNGWSLPRLYFREISSCSGLVFQRVASGMVR